MESVLLVQCVAFGMLIWKLIILIAAQVCESGAGMVDRTA
jgi:hypothetical protein